MATKEKLVTLEKNYDAKAIYVLSLNYKGYKTLPNFITELPHSQILQQLYLKRNSLISLPEKISNVVHLTVLYIPGNNLQYLPESVCELSNLTCLNVDANQLTTLPKNIGNLISLTKLQASHNYLTQIPHEIGFLKNLLTLELMFNDLTSIPDEIGSLHNLQVLNVDSNGLIQLPKHLGSLCNLIELSACKNKLRYLPQSLIHLKNLKYLLTDSNLFLTAIPDCSQIECVGFIGCGVYGDTWPCTLQIGSDHPEDYNLPFYMGQGYKVLLPLEIECVGDSCNTVPLLKETCYRAVYKYCRRITDFVDLLADLQYHLPYKIVETLIVPTSECLNCDNKIFMTAFPTVYRRTIGKSIFPALELSCSLHCRKELMNGHQRQYILHP